MPERRAIKFNSMNDVVADVGRLRTLACEKCGQWSLAQVCNHLDRALTYAMTSTKTPNTPEQDANQDKFKGVMTSGQLPAGIKAPEPIMPPADVPDTAIDDFIVTAKRFAAFTGPISTHRVFGNITDDEYRRLQLIHAAHHLSHIVPAAGGR